MTREYTIKLSEEYRYMGEMTDTIPATDVQDMGGMYLVECPDGSNRAFGKDEVLQIIDDE